MIFVRLFLLFTLIPIIELYILMRLGASFGVEITLLIVIGTGILGAYLAKREGAAAWFKIQREMSSGRFPGNELLDGFLVLIAGIVLLTPGLLTDITGFIILFPGSRYLIREFIKKRIKKMMNTGRSNISFFIGG
ncbi:MAG: FxsA family protein [Candidatus Aureabacteria bacterium]|nr:FxsA family protein [Candidatus Auribacterota bacterium]